MKTLREYIDILDEISRRDFLKTAGAAAAGAALGSTAKAQVGGGEDESEWAARRAASVWQQYARDNKTVTNWIYDTVQRRSMQFYQLGGSRDFQTGTEIALRDAVDAVDRDFQMFYRAIEKDKESGSLGKALLARALGAHDLSRSEQLKMIGSMQNANLSPTAKTFIQAYTNSLNRFLQTDRAPSRSYSPQTPQTPQTQQKLSSQSDWDRDMADIQRRLQDVDRYRAPQRESQSLEESEPEDSISKIDRLFRDA